MKHQITERHKPLTRKLTIRMTDGDWVLLDSAAKKRGQRKSDFARTAINKHMRRK